MTMRALRKFTAGLLGRVSLRDKPLPDPEPAYAKQGQVVGLRSLLTPEQKARVAAYTGPESFGDVPPHCA